MISGGIIKEWAGLKRYFEFSRSRWFENYNERVNKNYRSFSTENGGKIPKRGFILTKT